MPTGLEILQSIIRGERDPAPMFSVIPMEFVLAEEGRVVFHARASERHHNIGGIVHGGFAATVLDNVTGVAVQSSLADGQHCVTIELSIKMTRPIPVDETLIAEGLVLNRSRSLGISEGTLKTSDGKLLAHATATCFVKSD